MFSERMRFTVKRFVNFTVTQSEHQTITVTVNGNQYTSSFSAPFGFPWVSTISAESGYSPGTLSATSGVVVETNEVHATPVTPASYTFTITQSAHQTIKVTCNGVEHTSTFTAYHGESWTATITADTGYDPGTLSTSSGTVTGATEVHATSAQPAAVTFTITQSANQTIKVTCNGIEHSSTFTAHYGETWTALVTPSTGYTAGTLHPGSSGTVGTSPITVYADPAIEDPVLTFSSDDGEFTLRTGSNTKSWNGTLYYSTNKTNWLEWTGTSAISSSNNVLYVRGKNNTVITGSSGNNFVLTGTNIKCKGNIESLLDWEVVKAGNHPPMANRCYYYMFANCTSLITAPALPATTLADYCYCDMFGGCTSLTTAPALPATTLADYCYGDMFAGCTSLTTAPALPATTLDTWCYYYMFANCTSLTTPPDLPATTLAPSCYNQMFNGCTSLITPPDLPATNLADECYYYMFANCTSLYVSDNYSDTTPKVLFIPTSGTFVTGTVQEGVFRNCPGTRSSDDIIPTIGTQKIYYTKYPPYIRFSSADGDFTIKASYKTWNGTLYYSTNTIDWLVWTSSTISSSNKVLYLYGENNTRICSFSGSSWTLTGTNIKCTGNIETLLKASDVAQGIHPTMDNYCFYMLFKGCTSLISAPDLCSPTGSDRCYTQMFDGCTSLKTAPVIAATTFGERGCMWMFRDCTSLVVGTELPATTIGFDGYYGMFSGCTSLTSIPRLAVTTMGDYGCGQMFYKCTALQSVPNIQVGTVEYQGCCEMFYKCTSLVVAPSLLATTIKEEGCKYMFYGCTSLTTPPSLTATNLSRMCYSSLFAYCTSLVTPPTLPATVLAESCYHYMFMECTSLKTAPVLPATTLAAFCYSMMFDGCTKLDTAAQLPATELVNNCYYFMYRACLSLTVNDASTSETNIPYNIPKTGTFTNDTTQTNVFGFCPGVRSTDTITCRSGDFVTFYVKNTPVG